MISLMKDVLLFCIDVSKVRVDLFKVSLSALNSDSTFFEDVQPLNQHSDFSALSNSFLPVKKINVNFHIKIKPCRINLLASQYGLSGIAQTAINPVIGNISMTSTIALQ